MATSGKKLLDLMGGEKNIQSITHCATRLRADLYDHSKINVSEIKKVDEVMGVVEGDSQLQIIVGTNVEEVYDEIMEASELERREKVDIKIEEDMVQEKGSTTKKSNLMDQFIQFMVSIFSPLLPLLAGSGLLRGFTILANQTGILSEDSSTNLILTLAGTAVFHFFPVLVAVTAARRFKVSPFIAVAIVGSLIMPDFLGLVDGETLQTLTFMGLSVPLFNYTGQVLPAIVMVWLQSKIELFMKDKLPSMLHMVVIPTVLLALLVPVYAVVVGPIGNYISLTLASGVEYVLTLNSIIAGAVVGGIWNILIMFGVHWAPNTTIVIPNIALTGESAIIAYAATANFGMAGAALAVYIRTKNEQLKSYSITSITSVMFSGIVEPAIYGLGVNLKTPLIAGCLGAALGGAFMGAFDVVGYAFVFGGLTTIPAFAGPALWAYVVGLAISFIGGFAITLMLGFKEPNDLQL